MPWSASERHDERERHRPRPAPSVPFCSLLAWVETDQRKWWGTASFGAAGRVVLKSRVPRTWRMAAMKLDIAAARNRHDDEVIERRNAVHLFSDNWPVRRWASAWVAEQKTADPVDGIFEETREHLRRRHRRLAPGSETRSMVTGTAVRLGSVNAADFRSPQALASSVATLAGAYAEMDGFTVPYLEVAE